ncbi:hypothetical protein Gohar_000095 [Gossypium harknessii]|uniref:Uncharacterized protein n=1 Tax=Gossypium harknessii TaxID=34285 RepID=A0A7J9IF21_9ROSI|nr:hypothetical protein [Gossypium harknessii]
MINFPGKKREIRLNILIVMIMGAYLGQMIMTILMLIEEVGSPLTIQTQQVHTSVLGWCLKMHNCYVSFRNKMVNVKVIAKKIEATIRDHPKMKLREIQRRVALEMNVNVNMRKCRRAKKIVKDKLAGNFIEEFAMLWDYADELRLKNSESTINKVVNRVTPESPPHFKRFYVCFEALKRSGKEGCRPILGLDGCLLKGPFKGEILSTVGRDGTN